MGIFFVYILKSSVCLALFYLFYRLLLNKETFHRFNRLALLGVLVLSCLIPMIEVTTHEASGFLVLEEMMLMTEVEPADVLGETSNPFPWRALMLLVYVVGILFFVIRHLWSLSSMLRLLHASRKESLGGGIILFVHHDKDVAPFSWMKYIAVAEADLAENREAVLTHERAHIHNRHSWDLLLAEACAFSQWFNPAVWLLKQELQAIHEYEADAWVIKNGIDAKTYQLLLIRKAVGARLYSIANSFNHSSLKKRITMMIKKKSNPWARMKCLVAFPIAAVAVAVFARPEVSNQLDEISNTKINDLVSIAETSEQKNDVFLSNVKWNEELEADRSLFKRKDARIEDKKTSGMINEKSFEISSLNDVQSMRELLVTTQPSKKVEAPKTENTVVVFDLPLEDNMEAETSQKEDAVFRIVEEQPEFPGGMRAAMEFLGNNIKYPVEAQKSGMEGRVIVQFVVGKDGTVQSPTVAHGVSPELDAEAVRVISLMPKWKPGKQRGKVVAVNLTLPINFRLGSEQKKVVEGFQEISMKVDRDANKDNMDAVKNFFKDVRGVSTTATLGEKHNLEAISSLACVVVVDGVEKGIDMKVLKSVPLETIEKIQVLSAKNAVAKYGEKAKDGAIEIKTKKK